MPKPDPTIKINLNISRSLLRWAKKTADSHKMSFSQFVYYCIKVQVRKERGELIMPDDEWLLFTTQESRAYRRSKNK
jgi:hypothetical protein